VAIFFPIPGSGFRGQGIDRDYNPFRTITGAVKELRAKIMSDPQPGGALQVRPVDQELLCTLQERAPQYQLLPTFKRPYPVILVTVTPVKVQGIDNCFHLSR
jgi:hypothetical protein